MWMTEALFVVRIDQSHRYGHHQAACREPAGSYDKTTRTAICFEHKTQYLLLRAPYTRIMVFWHISNIPPHPHPHPTPHPPPPPPPQPPTPHPPTPPPPPPPPHPHHHPHLPHPTPPPMIRRVKLVVIPHVLYNNNFCEILLYNRQLVVITHELIYGVRAAIYLLGENYCETVLFHDS